MTSIKRFSHYDAEARAVIEAAAADAAGGDTVTAVHLASALVRTDWWQRSGRDDPTARAASNEVDADPGPGQTDALRAVFGRAEAAAIARGSSVVGLEDLAVGLVGP